MMVFAVVRSTRSSTQFVTLHTTRRLAMVEAEKLNVALGNGKRVYIVIAMRVHEEPKEMK